jgi:hypothetical protein
VALAEQHIRDQLDRVDEVRSLIFLEANRQARAEARGETAEAGQAADALETLLVRDPLGSWWLPILRAASLAQRGRHTEARAQLLQFAPDGPGPALRAMGPELLLGAVTIAIQVGDREWMRDIYDVLLPYAARNSVNLVLLVSDGPIAHHLGCLAAALGDIDQAIAHHTQALSLCQRAGFVGFAARARLALEALGRAPVTVSVAPLASAIPRLEQNGDLWTLSHEGREVHLGDSKGVRYLALLLAEPGRERHVGDLVQAVDAGPGVDSDAKAAYRQRLDELRDALEDAEARGDRHAIERLQSDRDLLAREIARAVGLGGRDGGKASAASERARINVQRRLRDVITRVGELDGRLGRHLELHVKTGVLCSFRP